MNVDELVDELRAAAAEQPAVSADLPAIVGRARRRQRRRLTGLGAVAAVAVLGVSLIASGDGGDDRVDTLDVEVGATWEPGGRAFPEQVMTTTLIWTGEEVLALGGDDFLCGAGDGCIGPSGLPNAALHRLDPSSGEWVRLAPAPFGIAGASTALVGDSLYVLTSESDQGPDGYRRFVASHLLRYHLDADRWEQVATPDAIARVSHLLVIGDDLLLYNGGGDPLDPIDLVLEADGDWSTLPAHPRPQPSERQFAWTGDRLLRFDVTYSSGPQPSLVQLSYLEGDRWVEAGEIPQLTLGPWVVDGDRLVNPRAGVADGGEVNGWGRTYPMGGILDRDTLDWSPLPVYPTPTETFAVMGSAGATLITDQPYPVGDYLVLLDLRTNSWRRVPALGGGYSSMTSVGTDDSIVAIAGRYGPGPGEPPPRPDTYMWDLAVSGEGNGAARGTPTTSERITTTTALSMQTSDRMNAACDAVSDDIDATHQWTGTSYWTVGDIDHDSAPSAAVAAWEDLDPLTPVAECSFALQECDDPQAISAIQLVYVTNYTRVDFAEPQPTDCDVYIEDFIGRLD